MFDTINREFNRGQLPAYYTRNLLVQEAVHDHTKNISVPNLEYQISKYFGFSTSVEKRGDRIYLQLPGCLFLDFTEYFGVNNFADLRKKMADPKWLQKFVNWTAEAMSLSKRELDADDKTILLNELECMLTDPKKAWEMMKFLLSRELIFAQSADRRAEAAKEIEEGAFLTLCGAVSSVAWNIFGFSGFSLLLGALTVVVGIIVIYKLIQERYALQEEVYAADRMASKEHNGGISLLEMKQKIEEELNSNNSCVFNCLKNMYSYFRMQPSFAMRLEKLKTFND